MEDDPTWKIADGRVAFAEWKYDLGNWEDG
jgi:hypothetical protein